MKLRNLLIYLVVFVTLACYVYFVEIKHKGEQQVQEEKAAKIVQLEKDKLVSCHTQNSGPHHRAAEAGAILGPDLTDQDRSGSNCSGLAYPLCARSESGKSDTGKRCQMG